MILLHYPNPSEETRMNLKLIGATALVISLLPGPALSRPLGESIYCATREPGNPHSRLCDYIITLCGANGDSAAVGTPRSIPLASTIQLSFRVNVAKILGANIP